MLKESPGGHAPRPLSRAGAKRASDPAPRQARPDWRAGSGGRKGAPALGPAPGRPPPARLRRAMHEFALLSFPKEEDEVATERGAGRKPRVSNEVSLRAPHIMRLTGTACSRLHGSLQTECGEAGPAEGGVGAGGAPRLGGQGAGAHRGRAGGADTCTPGLPRRDGNFLSRGRSEPAGTLALPRGSLPSRVTWGWNFTPRFYGLPEVR